MRVVPRLVYLACFIALGAVSAVALDRVVEASMSADLLRAVFLAAICAVPGLLKRRLWPITLILLPLGCYLVLRTTVPLPAQVEGLGEELRYFGEQLQSGASAYKAALFPLPVDDYPGLELILAFSLYWVIAAAGLLALGLQRPVWAVVLTLAVLGYSLTVDTSSKALWIALLFAVLSVCLIVICRGLARPSWRLRDAMAGGAVGVAGSLLAFGLLTAAPSVAATPWQDWRTWDPFGQGGSVYTFNWLQNYPRLLDENNDIAIMRVVSPLPSYWRASALDTFTGTAWVTSQAFLLRVEGTADADGRYHFDLPETELMPEGRSATQSFWIWDVYTNYFFAGGDPRSLEIDQSIPLRMNDMRSLRVATALGPTLAYTLQTVIPTIEPVALVGLGTEYPEQVERYRSLPFSRAADIDGPDKAAEWADMMSDYGPDGWEWSDLYALNDRIISGATDPYQIALRIERFLRQFYLYSLSPPVSEYSSPYAAFLFDTRSGYCQHFAGAMALLLRYNGIPARVAVGFTSGEMEATGAYLVSTNDAHAWIEAYFPKVGWVMFDPTPGRNIPNPGPSSTSPGFADPFTGTDTGTPGTIDNEDPRPPVTEDHQPVEPVTTAGGRGLLDRAPWAPWIGGLALILAGWPLLRALWRRRGLIQGPLEQRLQASLALLRSDLLDYGIPATPAHTLEEVLQIVGAHVGLEPDLALAERTDAVFFGGRRARPLDVQRTEALRSDVKSRMRKRRGWARTLRAWYGLPNAPRVGGT